MEDPGEYEIEKPVAPPVPPQPPRSRVAVWLIAALVVVVATIAFFFVRRESDQPQPASVTTTAPPEAPAAAAKSLGTEVEPIDLPPLDQTDALVRRLVGELSSHPRVAAWLATNGLIRNVVVAVENVSIGRTPAGHLRVLRPTGPFRVVERRQELLVDPASYDRYTPIAAAVQSIDAAGAARLYTTLKPRLEDAYRELGHEESFDRAFERAIVALLQVPVLEGEVRMAPKGALYTYEDARVERLTSAQKQLARMGPRNVRIIQSKLRDLAAELGMRTSVGQR